MNKTNKIPDPNKWIVLTCHDWSDYVVIGKWVPYKNGSKKGGGRFMRFDPRIGFLSDRDSWKDCEAWEYVPDPGAV